jgi:hypothetical protein
MIIIMPSIGFGTSLNKGDSTKNTVAVEYLGDYGDMMLINVQYHNPEGNKFNLTIYNGDGYVVYKQIYTVKDFERKFKIPKTEGKVNVVITSGTVKKKFEIASNMKMVENVVVKKIS